MAIRPFRVDIKEDVLTDLRERLRRTRWPGRDPGVGVGLRFQLGIR